MMKKTISILLAIVMCLSLLPIITFAATTVNISVKAVTNGVISDSGGGVTGGGQYIVGSTVKVTATTKSGYTFDGWYVVANYSESKVSSNTTYSFRVPEHYIAVKAKFLQIYTIRATTGGGGSVHGGGQYTHDNKATLTATPNSGYTFDGWYENQLNKGDTKVSSNTTYTFTANSDRTLTAKFTRKETTTPATPTPTPTPTPKPTPTPNYPSNPTPTPEPYYPSDPTPTPTPTHSDFVIENGVLKYYNGNGGDVVIPTGVTSIGDSAFEGGTGVSSKGLTSIAIPNGVTSIGNRAFFACHDLINVTIPNSVTNIGDAAFWCCSSLVNLTIPNGVTSIGSRAFDGCSSLESITIPSSVKTRIGSGMFDIKLTSVTINCDIGDKTFMWFRNLKNVIIGDCVTSIGNNAFDGCVGLTNITIPDSVKSIGDYAFYLCKNLTSVTIGNGVKSISESAFEGCPNLTICGSSGSYAETYANNNNIPFSTETADSEQPSENGLIANPTASTVYINGKAVAFDAYNINDNNYFKLRDLAYILNGTQKQFAVGWDGSANAISLTNGQPYIVVGGEMESKGAGAKTPTPTDSKILLNGVGVSLTAYNVEGNNYFKLRDIGAVFNFSVEWDGVNNAIMIDTSKGYTAE